MFTYDVLYHFRRLMERQRVDHVRVGQSVDPVKAHLDAYFLNSNYQDRKSYIFGSHLRGTALLGMSPIDVLYILPFELRLHIATYVDDALGWMSDIFGQIFAGTHWSIDANIKSASFLIRHPTAWPINLTPVFYNDDISFTTLDSLSDDYADIFMPFAVEDRYQDINLSTRRNLELLAKTVRFWAYRNAVPMSGFLIDCLAMNFIVQSPYRHFPHSYQDCLLRDFFKYLAELSDTQDAWPVTGTDAIAYRTGPFRDHAERAYHLVEQMIANSMIRQDVIASHALRDLIGEHAFHKRYMPETLDAAS